MTFIEYLKESQTVADKKRSKRKRSIQMKKISKKIQASKKRKKNRTDNKTLKKRAHNQAIKQIKDGVAKKLGGLDYASSPILTQIKTADKMKNKAGKIKKLEMKIFKQLKNDVFNKGEEDAE